MVLVVGLRAESCFTLCAARANMNKHALPPKSQHMRTEVTGGGGGGGGGHCNIHLLLTSFTNGEMVNNHTQSQIWYLDEEQPSNQFSGLFGELVG